MPKDRSDAVSVTASGTVTGGTGHGIRTATGAVGELYDLEVLPGAACPMAVAPTPRKPRT